MNIKKVCIVGGGSSGWMTAAAICKLVPHVELTIIESPDYPTVGVGESTLGHINVYMKLIGLKDEEWMPKCNATYKNSIRFTNFNSKDGGSFEYPFIDMYDTSYTHNEGIQIWGDLTSLWPETFKNTTFAEYFALTNTLLAKHNRATKNEDGKFPAFRFAEDTAYHMDATAFGQYLKNEICIPNGVKVLEKTIHSYTKDKLGNIEQVLCEDGTKLYADLWIDCTGFKSIMLEQWMGEQFISFKDYLQNDSAWACRIPYTDRKNQMENVTDCTALGNGWVWNIALWNRIGTGYCYSSRFTTKEEALREFFKHLKQRYPLLELEDLKPFHIDIKHGRRRRAWSNNVVGVGLSYGFVEPLESTGLLSTHQNIIKLVDILNRREGYVTETERHMFNFACQQEIDGFRDFVAMHYALSGRTDTPYWKYCTQVHKYKPEILGNEALALPNWGNAVGSPVMFNQFNPEMQGANFIQAGMGISNMNTPEMVKVKHRVPVDTPAEQMTDLVNARDHFLKQREYFESEILNLPTHYEFLLKNIYNNNDEYDG